MGIKHFFPWFCRNFEDSVHRLKKGQDIRVLFEEGLHETSPRDDEANWDMAVDNFMVDMNGIYHEAAQYVFRYGNYKPMKDLFNRKRKKRATLGDRIRVFQRVCEKVDYMVKIVRPKKRLIMCVDGPAPLSKQNQQRQRRFKSAIERKKNSNGEHSAVFDSNCITPGTEFMDYLSKYIDWYIKHKMATDSMWQKLEVVFSNEKVPAEGEQKLINFIRAHGTEEESYCVQGMDADLIMLSLGTHKEKFYLLRENLYERGFEYFFIDIGSARNSLAENMLWTSEKHDFDFASVVDDFIFICFTVGNDFLPHIPGIEIIEDGIDFMLDIYREMGESYGHLTHRTDKGVVFNNKPLKIFMGSVALKIKETLENKLEHKHKFFKDEVLESAATPREDEPGKWDLDMKLYRKNYYNHCFDMDNVDKKKICHDYLEGMQWVLTYYTWGVPNWKWRYPYDYAPFAHHLSKHARKFEMPEYGESSPTLPFVQLLCVLPPESASLIPKPLDTLLTSESSPLQKYCPDEIVVDLSGKRREWEGIILLPPPNYTVVEGSYRKKISKVADKEARRNVIGENYVYTWGEREYLVKSFYGNYSTQATRKVISF